MDGDAVVSLAMRCISWGDYFSGFHLLSVGEPGMVRPNVSSVSCVVWGGRLEVLYAFPDLVDDFVGGVREGVACMHRLSRRCLVVLRFSLSTVTRTARKGTRRSHSRSGSHPHLPVITGDLSLHM